ncbi:MAG: hypothetical protein ACK2UX_00495 [Anaerolineae bacterium]
MQTQSGASVAVSRELIGVGQVACLLAVATIEGQETPYWFIEQLAGLPTAPLDRWSELVRRLSRGVTPLSRYLLKTCETLAVCECDLRPVPLQDGERQWLMDRLGTMASFLERVIACADRETSPLNLTGLLIALVQLIGTTLRHVLAERTSAQSLRELEGTLRGVTTLYRATGYRASDQRHELAHELQLMTPVLSALQAGLCEVATPQVHEALSVPGNPWGL